MVASEIKTLEVTYILLRREVCSCGRSTIRGPLPDPVRLGVIGFCIINYIKSHIL